MQRRASSFAALAALMLVVGLSSRAEAGWGLRNSFGQSIWLAPPQVANISPPVVDATTGMVTAPSLVSGCGKALCWDGNRRMPVDFEVMPYYNFGLISLDLAVAFNLESRND